MLASPVSKQRDSCWQIILFQLHIYPSLRACTMLETALHSYTQKIDFKMNGILSKVGLIIPSIL